MTTHVLEPCPFCGNRSGATSDNSHGVVYVYCTNAACSSDGPVADSAEQAIAAWNRRPSPADQRPVRSEPATDGCDCCRRWQSWSDQGKPPPEVEHRLPSSEVVFSVLRGLLNGAQPSRRDIEIADAMVAMLEADRASRSPRDGEGEGHDWFDQMKDGTPHPTIDGWIRDRSRVSGWRAAPPQEKEPPK